jgi:diaminopimelate epimerase
MSSVVSFFKMHGLGNDFVMIDGSALPHNFDMSDLAKKISCRFTGVGCDQLIIYDKAEGYYNMEIYNLDGSKAGACGNATRCLAFLIGDQKISIKVGKRILNCEIVKDNRLLSNIVSVNMGHVSFSEPWMQADLDLFTRQHGFEHCKLVCADIGNPHLIVLGTLEERLKNYIGEMAQGLFKGGVNVNFAVITEQGIELSVWERGTGFTLACGSGACATFAAAVKLGLVQNQQEIIFKLGKLSISQKKEGIVMAGETKLVASGEYYYA